MKGNFASLKQLLSTGLIKNLFKNNRLCQIKAIKQGLVYVSVFGLETFTKYKIEDIIFDNPLIEKLPLEQLSQLGYEYGLMISKHKKVSLVINKFILSDDNSSRYNIISIQRNQSINYQDRELLAIVSSTIRAIFNNKALILAFPRTQIIYISFLMAVNDYRQRHKVEALALNKN